LGGKQTDGKDTTKQEKGEVRCQRKSESPKKSSRCGERQSKNLQGGNKLHHTQNSTTKKRRGEEKKEGKKLPRKGRKRGMTAGKKTIVLGVLGMGNTFFTRSIRRGVCRRGGGVSGKPVSIL